MTQRRLRITAVADSDSYLKLACAQLDRLGPEWERRVVLVRSPLLPTALQLRSAVSGTFMEGRTPAILQTHRLAAELRETDVVFAAATGPVAQEVFYRMSRARGPRAGRGANRPALVSALPGVAYPATEKALRYRALGDAFITHSHAESRAFSELAESLDTDTRILLGRLPFLGSPARPTSVTVPIRRVVFAAQAKMPFERAERERVLLSLADTALGHPGLDVVVKLRAYAGEPQTHLERHPYDSLWRDLVDSGRVTDGSVRFAAGPMSTVLEPGTALATVSSTAVIEALDRGLPAVVLGDFGVSERLLNQVFAGSGLLGTLDDVAALDFRQPHREWLRDNYFHTEHVGLGDLLAQLAERSRAGKLTVDASALTSARRRAARSRVRTALPRPLLDLLRGIRHRAAASAT